MSNNIGAAPTCLQAALSYLGRGWSVVALHGILDNGKCTCANARCSSPGKHPIGGSWKHLQRERMSKDEARRIFAKNPRANVGIITGQVSGGLVVLDIDGDEGFASLEAARIDLGVSLSPIVKTGRGAHNYFSAGQRLLGNFVGKLKGLDGRADGGYVVAPPSRHVSGVLYEFALGTESLAPAPIPSDVLKLFDGGNLPAKSDAATPLLSPPAPSPMPAQPFQAQPRSAFAPSFTPATVIGQRERSYALRALEGECATVRAAPIGQQETTLNRAALKIGHLVGAGAISESDAAGALTAAGMAMTNAGGREPWTAQEIEKKAHAGILDGMRQPLDFTKVNWKDGNFQDAPNYRTAKTDESPLQGAAAWGFVGFGSGVSWRTPEKLPPLSGRAPALDPQLLPDALRPWLVDQAERLQVSLEFVAMPALAALGAALGRKVGMFPKATEPWIEYSNLWAVIVGKPGQKKSPALSAAVRPLKRLEEDASAEHASAATGWKEANSGKSRDLDAKTLQVADMRRKASKGNLSDPERAELDSLEIQVATLSAELSATRPEAPRRFWTSDATAEKLGELLAVNPSGMSAVSDELSGWLASLNKQGREGERQFYLTGWNGKEAFTVDRVGRGTVKIPAVTLSVIGGIQGDILETLLANGAIDGSSADGMIQRFQLMVYPEPLRDYEPIDRAADLDAEDQATAVFQFAANLDPNTLLGQIDMDAAPTPGFRFTDEAQAIFYQWHTANQRRIRSEEAERQPALTSHLSKYDKLVAGVSLLDHVCALALSGVKGPTFSHSHRTVTALSVERAIKMAAFLEAHARKIYAGEIDPKIKPAYALAAKIRAGSVYEGMSVRDIDRSGWAGLKSGKQIENGLSELQALGWLRIAVEKPATGRPSQVVRLNPQLDPKAMLPDQ